MRIKSLSSGGLIGIALAGIGLATLGTYAAGYLTKVGPTALRFQPSREVVPAPVLPPLPKEDPVPEVNHVDAFEFTPTLTLMTDVVLSVLTSKGLIVNPNTNSLLPEQVLSATSFAVSQSGPQIVTPQMLVDYFRPVPGSTNGAGIGVAVPVEFMPATPAALPASRATYKTQ